MEGPSQANLCELVTYHDPSYPTTRAGAVIAKRHPLSTIQRGHDVVDPHLWAGHATFTMSANIAAQSMGDTYVVRPYI